MSMRFFYHNRQVVVISPKEAAGPALIAFSDTVQCGADIN